MNSWKDQEVRLALAPLAQLAERRGVAIVMIVHMNKAEGKSPIYRASGSIALSAASRAVFLVAQDPDVPQQRVLARYAEQVRLTRS